MAINGTVGTITFPQADTGATTLADFDTGRDVLLGLMEAAINYELATRWEDAIAGMGLGTVPVSPVQSALPLMPDESIMKQVGNQFPLLCCYRGESLTVEGRILDGSLFRQQLHLDYILAPVSAGSARKILDIFRAICVIAYACVEEGGHTAYALDATYTTQSKNVLGQGTGCANFHEIDIASAEFGIAKFSDESLKYHACSIVFNVSELYVDNSGDSDNPFEGASYTVGLGATPSTDVDDFSTFRSDV